MIPVPYYSTAYHIIISIFALILCINLVTKGNASLGNKTTNKNWCILLLLTTILFIGLRDPWASYIYFGDTGAYSRTFQDIHETDIWEQKDVGFYVFMKISSYILNINGFYLLCAFLYVYPVYVTFKKWFANQTVYALALYTVSFSFWAFGVNGVRNGLAVSFFIMAMGLTNRKWLMILLMLLSVSMHKSMLMPIVLFFASFFIKNTKYTIAIWFLSIAVGLLFGQTLTYWLGEYLDILEDPRAIAYSLNIWDVDEVTENIRFRPDFILYSAAAIVLGYFYVVKKGFKDKFYIQLLNTYILTNAIWIAFFMYAAFTNRYAYLSWCIMPVVMIYPLLKEKLVKNQYKLISYLILGSLVFTLIMFFR